MGINDNYFVRISGFDNSQCVRKPKLPKHTIHAWSMTEDTVLMVRDMYGGRVKIIDKPDDMDVYAIDFHELNSYVVGEHDVMPELIEFNEEEHTCTFGVNDFQVVFI